ncbi:MAG: enoyl-CoA hydratase/isomerase family protein [Ilumatobacteraceae bacterium]
MTTVRPVELVELLSEVSGDPATVLGPDALVLVDAGVGTVPFGWTPGALPVVLVGVADESDLVALDPAPYDVVLTPADPMLAAITDAVRRHPVAATSLAVLLRGTERRTVEDGLAAESAVYSTLQAGAEFAAWLAGTAAHRQPPDEEPPVLVERSGDELHVVLNRPRRHNAVSVALRDALAEALTLGVVDDSIRAVRLSGNGPSFCSGGDLGEFGSFPDPATAHVTRLMRSPARIAHHLTDRLHVQLHGACMGGGIEVAAFAGRVVAADDTAIALPEVALGLIPGAGGTASIPRRIGRHRTAALALSGVAIDAGTALRWGLVDDAR